MGRSRNKEQALASNSMVASAVRLGPGAKSYSKISATSRGWQADAWRFYHLIGEFRFSCDWVGSMLSKATLHATREVQGVIDKVTEGPAFDYVDSLFGDTDGKTEMLRLIGIHMTVAGECYIIGYPNPENPKLGDKWQVIAAHRLRNAGTDDDPVWHINGQALPVAKHEDVLVVRIWRPDPEEPELAISPARAILSVLGEIYKLTEHVNAQVNSRLAGAGVLLMPSEMSLPAGPEAVGSDGKAVRHEANTADALVKILQSVMSTAIEDRGDPSALVPIVITAPGEVIDNVKHMTFWTELDAHAIDLRNEAIRRLALGMDMPPEVLQGVSESNHWSAWQSDESAIKSHTEPLLKIVTSALAEGYLRPLLLGDTAVEGFIEHYSIRADTSELRMRPNRSKEALELHQMGLLSDKALLRETGFDPEDGLTDDERKTWFLRKLASGSTTPEQVEAAMRIMFPGIPLDTSEPEKESTEARPDPSLREHPERGVPDAEISTRRKIAREEGRVPSAHSLAQHGRIEAITAATDQIVVRALERAGNKMKSNMQVKPKFAAVDIYRNVEVPADQVAFLLTDAWAHVPRIAERYGIDPVRMTAELDNYTTELLLTGAEHTFERLHTYLTAPITEGDAA